MYGIIHCYTSFWKLFSSFRLSFLVCHNRIFFLFLEAETKQANLYQEIKYLTIMELTIKNS